MWKLKLKSCHFRAAWYASAVWGCLVCDLEEELDVNKQRMGPPTSAPSLETRKKDVKDTSRKNQTEEVFKVELIKS